MQIKNVKGITDLDLIQKYVDKFMSMEVTELYRVEEYEGKRHFTNSVMNTYLRQDIALNFVDEFFEGHCSYAEMLTAMKEGGKSAVKEEWVNEKRRQNAQGSTDFYDECTAADYYYWAISMTAGALLQYAECSLLGHMFCGINIEAMGKYVCAVKYRKEGPFFFFDEMEEDLKKDIRNETMGDVIRQLLQQIGSGWKCGGESLSDYRYRIRRAQKNLEHVIYAALATVYQDRFQMTALKEKYTIRTNMDEESEKKELSYC